MPHFNVEPANSPNLFGELLLANAMPTVNGRGFYQHHEVASNWSEIPKISALFKRIIHAMDLVEKIDGETITYGFCDYMYGDFSEQHVHAYTDGEAIVANFWDGDGTTVCGFIASNQWVINTDAKKDHGWEIVISEPGSVPDNATPHIEELHKHLQTQTILGAS